MLLFVVLSAKLRSAGPHAVCGMQMWSAVYEISVGFAGRVGNDFPSTAREELAMTGLDVRGLVTVNLPTPRAWTLYCDSERDVKQFFFRTNERQYSEHFRPTAEDTSKGTPM